MPLLRKWRIRSVWHLRRRRRKYWRTLRLPWLRWPVFCNLFFWLYWKGELKSSPFFCVNCLLTNAPQCGIIGRGDSPGRRGPTRPEFPIFYPIWKISRTSSDFHMARSFPETYTLQGPIGNSTKNFSLKFVDVQKSTFIWNYNKLHRKSIVSREYLFDFE